jgi:uncharacterized oxidoreductase
MEIHREQIMKTTGNTILITGGATGIGLALTEVLLNAGNEVIICGRREQKLIEAKNKLPKVHIKICNVADLGDRKALLEWTTKNFPQTNILVNNAGIQREINLRKGAEEFESGEDEIEINLRAPIHLSALFIPHLLKKNEAAIANISSGLGFAPLAFMPVYCATKAAIHSFSWSLRHQLKETTVKVFEIIPPTVDTELDQGARAKRGQQDRGISAREVAQAALDALSKDEFELAVGRAQFLRLESRKDPERLFQMMNIH